MYSRDPHHRPVNPDGKQNARPDRRQAQRPYRGQPASAPRPQSRNQGKRPLTSPHHPYPGADTFAPPVSARGNYRPAPPQRNPHDYDQTPDAPRQEREYFRGPYTPNQENPYYEDPDVSDYGYEYRDPYAPADYDRAYDPYDSGYRPGRNTLAGDPYEEEQRSWTRWLPTIIAGLVCVICVILLLILLL